jgi:hypothetical protein
VLDDKDEFEDRLLQIFGHVRRNVENFIKGADTFATEEMLWRYGQETYPFSRFKGLRMAGQYLKVCARVIDEDLRNFHARRQG